MAELEWFLNDSYPLFMGMREPAAAAEQANTTSIKNDIIFRNIKIKTIIMRPH